MIIEGIDVVDLNEIQPGCTVKLKIVDNDIVKSLLETANTIGCKLIFIKYGEFFFREYRSRKRSDTIDNILSDL